MLTPGGGPCTYSTACLYGFSRRNDPQHCTHSFPEASTDPAFTHPPSTPNAIFTWCDPTLPSVPSASFSSSYLSLPDRHQWVPLLKEPTGWAGGSAKPDGLMPRDDAAQEKGVALAAFSVAVVAAAVFAAAAAGAAATVRAAASVAFQIQCTDERRAGRRAPREDQSESPTGTEQDEKEQDEKEQGEKEQGEKEQGEKEQGEKEQGEKEQGEKEQGEEWEQLQQWEQQ
ncbi:unnamed protein product [Closterium sp. NIES-53]